MWSTAWHDETLDRGLPELPMTLLDGGGVQPIVSAVEPREVVVDFWDRIQSRDWDGLGRLLADDFVVEWPDARLRIRGRQNFVQFNRTYPEGWTIEVLGIVAEGNTVVSEVRVPHTEQGIYYVLSILNVDGDRLAGGREYWLEEHEQALPAERARLFEPMCGHGGRTS
jgi:ketosteroid isomerase-like protein